MLGTAEVYVIAPSDRKMVCMCKKCGKQHSETTGKLTLGIKITDGGRHYGYVLGVDHPRTTCCGEDVAEIMTFETDAAAQQERVRVVEHLCRKHSTEGLKLLSIYSLLNRN